MLSIFFHGQSEITSTGLLNLYSCACVGGNYVHVDIYKLFGKSVEFNKYLYEVCDAGSRLFNVLGNELWGSTLLSLIHCLTWLRNIINYSRHVGNMKTLII